MKFTYVVQENSTVEVGVYRERAFELMNKIGRPRSWSPSMITDRIGRHDVLLPINHYHYNFTQQDIVSSNLVCNHTRTPTSRSIATSSPRAHISSKRHAITWVSNHRYPILPLCNGYPLDWLPLQCYLQFSRLMKSALHNNCLISRVLIASFLSSIRVQTDKI